MGYSLAGVLNLIPDFDVGASGFGGSPDAVVETGGSSFGDSADDLVKTLESISKALDKDATLSSTLGSYQRRQDEWEFQQRACRQGDRAARSVRSLPRSCASTIAQTRAR